MSISVSIDITLKKSEIEMVSPIKVIETFLRNGWKIRSNEKVTYLPIGDDDNFDWQTECISDEMLDKILRKKEEAGEIIGLAIMWKDTNVGGTLLIWNDCGISFNPSINRKVLKEGTSSNFTDVSWYLEKLIPVFNARNFTIEKLSFEQHI
jgi:hypothetical protein